MSRKSLFFLFCFQIVLASGGKALGSGGLTTTPGEAVRNPFVTEDDRRGRASRDGEQALRGILWSEHEPYAVIGSKVVKVGDVLANWQVTEIRRESVTLSKGKRLIELTFNGKNK